MKKMLWGGVAALAAVLLISGCDCRDGCTGDEYKSHHRKTECKPAENCPEKPECKPAENCPEKPECKPAENCPEKSECKPAENCPEKADCTEAKDCPASSGTPTAQ